MPKDKEGNKLTWKEFMGRWKSGIEGITPQQKLSAQINGARITLLGLILGLIVSIIGWHNLWWVAIVLIGGLITQGIQYLGLIQQKLIFKKIEEQLKDPEEKDLPNTDLIEIGDKQDDRV